MSRSYADKLGLLSNFLCFLLSVVQNTSALWLVFNLGGSKSPFLFQFEREQLLSVCHHHENNDMFFSHHYCIQMDIGNSKRYLGMIEFVIWYQFIAHTFDRVNFVSNVTNFCSSL